MAELDYWEIKSRLELILENNSTLYNASSTDGTKLILIETGAPNTNDMEQKLPALYITNDDIFDSETPPWNVSSNSGNTFEHDLTFLLIYAVAEVSPRRAEEILDDMTKTIKEVIKGNYNLQHPTNNNDPKVARSYIESVGIMNPSISKNNQTSGRVMRLRCVAFT